MGKQGYISEDVERDFRRLAESSEPRQGGVVLAIPTGEFLDDDPTYIEVLIGGKSYFVKPCYSFGGWSVPNKEWLAKYKDEIGVWVAFENENPAHGVYLGVCPLDFNAPQDFYINGSGGKSVHFEYAIDDEEEQAFVKHENGNEVHLSKDHIKLRNENGDEVTVEDGKIELLSNEHTVTVDSQGISIKSSSGRSIKVNDSVILGLGVGTFSVVHGETLQAVLTNAFNTIANDVLIVNAPAGIAVHSPAAKTALTNAVNALATIMSKTVKTD